MPVNDQLGPSLRQRLLVPLLVFLATLVVGTFGYYYLIDGQASLFDCLYMVIITLATVGYGETIPIENNVPARAFTMVLILAGMGALLYLVTQMTAFFIEGELTQALRRRRMDREIERLKEHVILCGAGPSAYHAACEMLRTGWPLVVVDESAERLAWLARETAAERGPGGLLLSVEGDPTDDRVLARAGLARARGLVAATEDDKENLFIVVTARQSRPASELRLIAGVSDTRSISKLAAAGADKVISPSAIGGMRMASEMIRPSVVTFLDIMLKDKDENLRVEEVDIGRDPDFVGKRLDESRLREDHDMLVLAVRESDGRYRYRPPADYRLTEDLTLIVLSSAQKVQALRAKVCRAG